MILFLNVDFVFTQSINVSIPTNAFGEPDSSVIIPIVVGDLTGRGVIAYQANIKFDASVLNAAGALSSGTVSGSFGPPTVNISEDGEINVGGFGASPLSGSGTLVNLTFDVVGQLGDTTALVFDNFVFNSGDPAAEVKNGKFTVSLPTSVHDEAPQPENFFLRQNYPNPFNPETTITFEVPPTWNDRLTLQIFNLKGQLIKTLVNGFIPAGTHVIVWDSRDERGKPASSGSYFYKIKSGNFVAVRKMVLIK